MDNRRRSGLIALVVLVGVAVALFYYQQRGTPEPTTAFAPAQSADESVAPPDTPVEVAAGGAGDATGEPPAAGSDGSGAAEVAAVVPGEDEASPPAAEGAAPEADVAAVDPGAEMLAPAAEPAAPVDPGAPTFDIVRVEPSGETVIAGQAEPNATVEIVDAGTVIAMAEANEAGDWAIALEEPLDPGTHDLAIQTTSEDESIVTLSDERVTVSVPDDGTDDVLVVLNAPGAASTVMQVPPGEEPAAGETAPADAVAEAPAAGTEPGASAAQATAETAPEATETEQQVAAVEPPAETPGGQPAATSGAGTAAAGADEVAAAAPEASAASQTDVAASAPEGEATGQVAAAASEASPAAGAGAAPAVVASEGAPAGEPATAEAEATTAAETNVATAPAVETPEPPAPPPPVPEVIVAAVEADTDGTIYVAGTATTGEVVRVYLDDSLVGDAVPSPSGTWIVEATLDLPAGSYLVRADQVADAGEVIARTEVPFLREVEVAILKPVGATMPASGGAVAGAMPEVETVIIKKGDNLWRIARAAWGKGVRWSTIYEANGNQILDPHWIYPGQVFVMPKADATWQN